MGESNFSLEHVLSNSDYVFVDASSFTSYYQFRRRQKTTKEKEIVYGERLEAHNFWINALDKSGVNGYGKIVVPSSIYTEIKPIAGTNYKRKVKRHSNRQGRVALEVYRNFQNSQISYRKLDRKILDKGLVQSSKLDEQYLGVLEEISPQILRIKKESLARGDNSLSKQDIDLFLVSLLNSFSSRVSLVSNDTKIRYLWTDVLRAGIGKESDFHFYHFVKGLDGNHFQRSNFTN